MGDKELAIKSEDACAIPKWGPSRGLRYEVDDFIVSPPSNEDGGFFHLRYGQRSKPRASTYDRINQELAMTIEVKDGDPVISEVGLSGVEKESPTLTISPTGLCPSNTATAENTPDSASVQRTKPLFVLDWKNFKLGSSKEETEDPSVEETPSLTLDEDIGSRVIPSVIEELKATESEGNNDQKVEKSSTFAEEIIKRENQAQDHFSSKKEKIEVSLVEKVQSLQVSPVAETPFMTPPFSTPLSTPLTTPQTSPVVKRKIYNVVMDQGANHGYFCTKPFQGSQQISDSSAYMSGGGGGSVGLSATSVQMTQQLESSSKVAAALEPGQKLGKKRRPKPSTLREMNFWAPTSM